MVLPREIAQLSLDTGEFVPQPVASSQDSLRRSLEHDVARDEFTDPFLVASLADRAKRQAKVAKNATKRLLDVEHGFLKRRASAQEGPQFLCRDRFAVNGAEPAHPQQPGNPFGVPAIGLHRHRLQDCLDPPRLQ